MKLDAKSELGLRLVKDGLLAAKIIMHQLEQVAHSFGMDTPEYNHGERTCFELLDYDEEVKHNLRHYKLTDSAMELVDEIPLGKFDLKILKQLPNHKVSFLLGKNQAFRYFKEGEFIYILLVYGDDRITSWRFAKLDLNVGSILLPPKVNAETQEDIPLETVETVNGYDIDAEFHLLLRLIIFTSLSEIKIEYLKPNEKIGTRRAGKYINQSLSDIQIINSKWNVVSIRNLPFKVRGHWRLQACGDGMTERRLIWVDTFEKKGYIRNKIKA